LRKKAIWPESHRERRQLHRTKNMNLNFKKILVGFGFFFLSYVVARLIDAKLNITGKVADALPGYNKPAA